MDSQLMGVSMFIIIPNRIIKIYIIYIYTQPHKIIKQLGFLKLFKSDFYGICHKNRVQLIKKTVWFTMGIKLPALFANTKKEARKGSIYSS